MKILDVNTKDTIRFTNRLEKMHRSDFPLAVRGTLNDLAFHHKSKELIIAAEEEFIIRQKNFFKAHSGVDKADGWDVNKMASQSGITPRGSKAAKQLEKQETGGTIQNRPLIYVDPARGGNKANKVKRRNWVNKQGYVRGGATKARSRRSAMVAKAVMGRQTGKLIKLETRSSEHFFRVRSVRFVGRGSSRRAAMRMTAIASYEKGRSIRLRRKHPFMQKSGERTLQMADDFYIKNAKKRFEKALSK